MINLKLFSKFLDFFLFKESQIKIYAAPKRAAAEAATAFAPSIHENESDSESTLFGEFAGLTG